jgi:hypothetical protein
LNCAGTGESSVVSCKFFTSTSKREETLTWKSCSRLGLILDPDCRLEINPSPSKIVSPLKGKTPSVSSFAVGKLLERTSFRELQFSGTDFRCYLLGPVLEYPSQSRLPILSKHPSLPCRGSDQGRKHDQKMFVSTFSGVRSASYSK